jgi:GT2 family glycosyltransferase
MAAVVSAVVVAYRADDVVAACLARLAAALERVEGETELVVVANGPPLPGSSLPPGALVVPGSSSLGFAGGVSAALSEARG